MTGAVPARSQLPSVLLLVLLHSDVLVVSSSELLEQGDQTGSRANQPLP